MAKLFQKKIHGSGSKVVGKRHLIVCEGLTEVNYLKGFKQTLSREAQRVIRIEPVQSDATDALSIVNDAIRRKDLAIIDGVPYDDVWVFFDDDNQKLLQKAFDRAKKEKVKIAFSSISLELWFLLHYKYTSRKFADSAQVEKELIVEWPQYKKPAYYSWQTLESRTLSAISNSKKLRSETAPFNNISFQNPFTNIDELLVSLGFQRK